MYFFSTNPFFVIIPQKIKEKPFCPKVRLQVGIASSSKKCAGENKATANPHVFSLWSQTKTPCQQHSGAPAFGFLPSRATKWVGLNHPRRQCFVHNCSAWDCLGKRQKIEQACRNTKPEDTFVKAEKALQLGKILACCNFALSRKKKLQQALCRV